MGTSLCVVHAWKSGILVAATPHLAATVPDLPFVEYTVSESPLRRELVRSSVTLPTGSGSYGARKACFMACMSGSRLPAGACAR